MVVTGPRRLATAGVLGLSLALGIAGCSGIVRYNFKKSPRPVASEDVSVIISRNAATIEFEGHRLTVSRLALWWTGSKDWGGGYVCQLVVRTAADSELTLTSYEIVSERPDRAPDGAPTRLYTQNAHTPRTERGQPLPYVFAENATEAGSLEIEKSYFVKRGRLRVEFESGGASRSVEIAFST
jgi:hypothetical protein